MAKKRKKPTTTWGKIWYFIWYDNSLTSWFVNIILSFILIKFVIFPVLGAILGTSLPIVAVVSESMDHRATPSYTKDSSGACQLSSYKLCSNVQVAKPHQEQNFDNFWYSCGDWYEEKGISKEEFQDYPFANGFSKGDIIILIGKEPEEIKVGDVMVFQAKKPYPIIHRVVNVTEQSDIFIYETKGDHNAGQITDPFLNEQFILENQLMGVAVAKIPWLGWIKIGLVELLQGGRVC